MGFVHVTAYLRVLVQQGIIQHPWLGNTGQDKLEKLGSHANNQAKIYLLSINQVLESEPNLIVQKQVYFINRKNVKKNEHFFFLKFFAK